LFPTSSFSKQHQPAIWTVDCFNGKKKVFEISHNFSGWNIIYSTDATAKFFITKLLIGDIKLIQTGNSGVLYGNM